MLVARHTGLAVLVKKTRQAANLELRIQKKIAAHYDVVAFFQAVKHRYKIHRPAGTALISTFANSFFARFRHVN